METLIEDKNVVSLTGYRGEMTKNIATMTAEELKIWQKEATEQTKAYLFSINMPLVYRKNGKMIAEYADGSITVIR